MPELPEVETGRRIVERELVGLAVVSVLVRLPKLMRLSPIPTLDPLVGERVQGARRRGKILVIDFSGGLSVLVHLKLAGQLSVHRADGRRATAGHPVPSPEGPYPHKTTHIEFLFDDGTRLYLSDVRQFGWVRLLHAPDVDLALIAFGLGPEAMGTAGGEGITAGDLRARLRRRTIPVKLALLDQRLVAGIGNIYVDEALHRARIHPRTPAHVAAAGDVETLLSAIQWALAVGIEQGGAKIVNSKAYQLDGFPEVHAREGHPCPVCGAAIIKIRVGGRGTYLCPDCQSAEPSSPPPPSS